MDTESGTSYDSFLVRVLSSGGPPTQVWAKNSPGFAMKSWFEATIDLAKWAGQTVTIQFVFDSMDEVANETEGVYLDDVSVTRSCTPAL
jgi:bacillopeptidase F (M6 metalloprotease family)